MTKTHERPKTMHGALRSGVLVSWLVPSCEGCAVTTTERLGLPPLQTAAKVDLPRYTGTWDEIASYFQRFQDGGTGTAATYTGREDGDFSVVNHCRKGSLDGEEIWAEGRARVVDKTSNAKLEVTFFWPFWGRCWIVDLGKNYEYAVVGHPGRDDLWVLSRTPAMEDAILQGIFERQRAKGYSLDRLQKTPQPGSALTSSGPVGR